MRYETSWMLPTRNWSQQCSRRCNKLPSSKEMERIRASSCSMLSSSVHSSSRYTYKCSWTITENMHFFVADMAQHGIGPVVVYTRRAEAFHDENLSAYVKLTTRRFFAKLIVSCLDLV